MGTITRYDRMRTAIAEAYSVDEVKDIRDKAKALEEYARQAKDVESQNQYAEIRIRAERRAGEMLIEMKENGERNGQGGDRRSKSQPVTLIDIGIGKMQSSRWQAVAAIPEEVFEEHIAQTKSKSKELTSGGVLKVAKATRRREKRPSIQTSGMGQYGLIHSSIESLSLPDASIDVIVTDPPYPQEYLPLFSVLSHLAERVLKPGGSLFVMSGQSYLPEVICRLSERMRYHWVLSYLTPGGQATQLWKRNVNTFWKPVLWFVKDKYDGKWLGDVSGSKTNDNDKRFHGWGQSESGMIDLVQRCTEPGQTILDPFCGGGATGVAALLTERHFIGSDRDAACIETCRGRLSEIANADL